MSDVFADQNYTVENEPVVSKIELKQLQDTLKEYNKKKKHLSRKMEKEAKLWNKKLKELTKCIEKVVHYERARELRKKSIKKERHIRNIVRTKRLQRLKAMAELRESDRIQYEKEQRLHRKLLSRPARPHPIIVAMTRKLKNAKTRRDALGKEADELRSKFLQMEAQLNLIKIKPLRKKIKQIKNNNTNAKEINNQVGAVTQYQQSQIINPRDATNKQKCEDSVMNVAIKSTKRRQKTLGKISMNRFRKKSVNPCDQLFSDLRTSKKKQTVCNNRKLKQQNSSKVLHETKESAYKKKSKDTIVSTNTRNKTSRTKVLLRRKNSKSHNKSKLQKKNSTNNDANSIKNKKSNLITSPVHVKNAPSMVAQAQTEVNLTTLVDLKQLNVNTISTMALASSNVQPETLDNVNGNPEQGTLETLVVATKESTNTVESLKNQIEQIMNVVEDVKLENKDCNVSLENIQEKCEILNSSKTSNVIYDDTIKKALGDGQTFNKDVFKLLQTNVGKSTANTASSEMISKLNAAFAERGLNQGIHKPLLVNDTLEQSNSLTNVIYYSRNHLKGSKDVRNISETTDYDSAAETIKQSLAYLQTLNKNQTNLMNMECPDSSSMSPIKRKRTSKMRDLDSEKFTCTETDKCRRQSQRIAPAYDKLYFRRLLKQEFENAKANEKSPWKSNKLFKGKLYDDIVQHQLHDIGQKIISSKPKEDRDHSRNLKPKTSTLQIEMLYNNLDESILQKPESNLEDIKSGGMQSSRKLNIFDMWNMNKQKFHTNGLFSPTSKFSKLPMNALMNSVA